VLALDEDRQFGVTAAFSVSSRAASPETPLRSNSSALRSTSRRTSFTLARGSSKPLAGPRPRGNSISLTSAFRISAPPERDSYGDIPIAGDEPSDLTSGAFVVGVAEATLHRQPGGLDRLVPGLHPASVEPVEAAAGRASQMIGETVPGLARDCPVRSEPAVVRGPPWCLETAGLHQKQQPAITARRACLQPGALQIFGALATSALARRAAFSRPSSSRTEQARPRLSSPRPQPR